MSTTAATLLSRITTELTQPVRHDLSTDSLNRWLQWLAKLQTRIEAGAAALAPLLTNKTYSDVGRAGEIAKTATGLLAQFTWMGPIADDLDAATERLRGQLFDIAPSVKDPMLRELRAGEIRSDLRDLAPHEIDAEFLKASQTDRDEVLLALLNSPTGPMVSDDMRERALTKRAQRLMPEVYANWRNLETLRESWASWREHVALWLKGLGADQTAIEAALRVPADVVPDGYKPLRGVEWAKAVLQSA